MRGFRSSLLPVLIGFLAITPVRGANASAWKLPPLEGELTGDFAALFGGAPKLNWKIAVRTEKPRERTVTFSIDGSGAKIRGEARVDPMGEGTWRVTEAEVNLGEWFGWAAPVVSRELAGISAGGTLTFEAEGTWRDNVLGGRAKLSLREGKFDDTQRKVLLEGISVDVEIEDLATLRTAPAQVFTWRSGRYDVVPLGVGRIEFAMDKEQIRVTSALIDVFGGELQIGSLVMATQTPEFSVEAKMVGVSVDQILFLLPPVLAEAKGRLDGQVALRRDASGIQIGDGRLSLRQGETADLRLAIKPGWLTTSLPPDIVEIFPAYGKMERGEIPVRAHALEITFTPLGDARGRTGYVRIAGGPSDPELTAPMNMEVNVRGPLEQLVKLGADLGTDSRLRFSGAK